MLKAHRKLILILALVFVSLFLRFYKLGSDPVGLYYDEVDLGYQARSILETGRDYLGTLSPFYVNSFVELRTPIPAYATAITTAIFKTPELQVRAPSAILGTVVVVLIFVLLDIWTENFALAFIVALVFAFNPWQLQFSRFSHEANSLMTFFLLGLIFFFKGIKQGSYKKFLLATIFLSLDVYTYRTMSLYLPVVVLGLIIIYRKEIWKLGIKKLSGLVLIGAVIVLPFLYTTTIGSADTPRAKQLALFSEQSLPVFVQRDREVDSNDYADPTIGKKASQLSYFFHNKPLSWLRVFTENYYSAFSMDFLFLKGDLNQRQSIGEIGELYYIDILALIAGFYFVGTHLKKKHFQFLVLYLLTSPIPSALTFDGGGHAGRLFIYSGALLIVVGLGWWWIFDKVRKLRFSKFFMATILGAWLLMFVFYLHRYYVHYPIDSSRSWGYGFKQAIADIDKYQKDYKEVLMFPTADPPMMYYLFWSNTPPKQVQEYGSNFSPDHIEGKPLDKFKVGEVNLKDKNDPTQFMEPGVLYLVTPDDFDADFKENMKERVGLPKAMKILDQINYPDNIPAFYLITKDATVKASTTK